jgi:hypothetical protein
MPYPKGKPQSESSKQLRREKMLAKIAEDPERWRRLASKAGRASTTPEICAQRVVTMRERGNLLNGVAAMAVSQSRVEVRLAHGIERALRFNTPEGRAIMRRVSAASRTPEVNERRRAASRAYAITPAGRAHKSKAGNAALKALRGASAKKKHEGFRSSWELRFARWLDSLGVRWVYEPDAFELNDGRHYTPDFLVRVPGLASPVWVEIKALRRGTAEKFHAWRAEWGMQDQSILLAEDVFAVL